ncbi:hypothetical protein [Dictyobacter formicarum]|uniref:Cohesin domain-containing protein n=1 Tax=Dictyobacter formicarum TaxID=2778368 RepID=A0ABQ3VIQ3_9CHLR|nr:hypothetical protein [Dictyobacter formicarum]GHO85665.1 hypothetical protein KSZ_36710 [Dictyobacter formicarum]
MRKLHMLFAALMLCLLVSFTILPTMASAHSMSQTGSSGEKSFQHVPERLPILFATGSATTVVVNGGPTDINGLTLRIEQTAKYAIWFDGSVDFTNAGPNTTVSCSIVAEREKGGEFPLPGESSVNNDNTSGIRLGIDVKSVAFLQRGDQVEVHCTATQGQGGMLAITTNNMNNSVEFVPSPQILAIGNVVQE